MRAINHGTKNPREVLSSRELCFDLYAEVVDNYIGVYVFCGAVLGVG